MRKNHFVKKYYGAFRPCAGDIYIRGKNTKEMSVSGISKEVGYVMQNPDNQLFTDSVYNETAFALKKMRLSKNKINELVKDALLTVGLDDADAHPHALNRTDRAKLVIACVLAMGSKIIILDEVDAGSDYQGSKEIMKIIQNLQKKGFTIIFITHNMFLADKYANRLIKMERNGVVFDDRR